MKVAKKAVQNANDQYAAIEAEYARVAPVTKKMLPVFFKEHVISLCVLLSAVPHGLPSATRANHLQALLEIEERLIEIHGRRRPTTKKRR